MNKTYLYRKHLRAPLLYLICYEGTIFIAITLLVFGIFLIDQNGIDTTLLLIIGLVLLVTFVVFTIEMVFLYFIMFRRFKSISVSLTEDSIIYTNAKSRKVVPYTDILSLQFPSIKYAGGWVKIKYQGGTIRLTVVLEEIGEFISILKEKLNERGMEQSYNEKKLFSFYKTAVFSDESWDRIYHNYKSYLLFNFISIIVNTLILRYLAVSGDKKSLLYGSVIAPLIGLVISEILIGRKVRKRVDRESLILLPRDLNFERKVYWVFVAICSCAYPLILILLSQL